jgi:hypothetical protein
MNSSDDRPGNDGWPPTVLFAVCLVPFLFLATLNSAGYRYGASDQAFYAPAVLEGINPLLYPRDSDLIRSQARLTLVDEVIGPIGRVSGLPLPYLFAALHVLTLALLALAAIRIGGALYRTGWAVVGLLAAITLRHAIIRSGTNTLEGYFHPRQLSFAIGAMAVASFLRGGTAIVALLVAAAFALHPTTGLWFAIWMGVATYVAQPALRRAMLAGAAACAVAAAWALSAGPLGGRVVRMDQEWLATLAAKSYLFPLGWPGVAWLVNLGYAPIIYAVYRYRARAGLHAAREPALVAGCLALLPVFLATVPFNAARIALAIQLQPARIFWMLDFLATIYVVWVAVEGITLRQVRMRLAAAALVLLAAARGTYVMFIEFPGRRIAQTFVNDDDWGRAMRWARTTPIGSGWLAAPDHAVLYGTSVRVAAERDVFVEAIKDSAVGMYERSIALRTRDRVGELGDFPSLTAERARAIAAAYGLDYLITEDALDLPIAFSSGRIRVYRLTPGM